jgi:serine/threonine-protein kinase
VVDARYRIEAVAGAGGHSVVYRASHLALDVPVALKVRRPPKKARVNETEQADGPASSFRTEGRVLFRMGALHSSFVQAKDTGLLVTGHGTVTPYLVLEWLAGFSLAQMIRGQLAVEDMIRLLDAPSRGLAMAHARGIAHRDLKPGNVFIVRCDGVSSVKVLDFGLAKVQADDSGVTSKFANDEQETRAFTAAYAAPEQWLQRLGATGTWTDVYSWALLCSELLSGRPPVPSDCEQQLMAACLDASRRPTPRALGVEVPPEVERVFARALSIDPRRRFRQIGHFWDALCLAAGSSPADVASVPRSVSAAATSVPVMDQVRGVGVSAEPPTEDER